MFVDERFIIKAQFDAELASLRWSGPSYKRSGDDSEPQTVSETASRLCFVGDRAQVLVTL